MVLGMNYSRRKSGNCRGVLETIESSVESDDFVIVDVPDLSIRSCCDYNYGCFKTGSCCTQDDFSSVLELMKKADKIIVAIPVYRGHLCSEYYKFHERICGVYRLNDMLLASDYLDKTTFIVFANRGSGYEEVIIDMKRDIEPYGGKSKVVVIASRDYEESSIDGAIKNNPSFRRKIEEEIG